MKTEKSMDSKNRLTENIKNIVEKAKNEMPSEAVNMRLYEKYHTKIGPLQTYHTWESIDCVYFDKEGNVVKKVQIKEKGSWQFDSDPANYVLYNEGLWKPYDYDTWNHKIKHIKEAYESLLNADMIYPIDEIYSDEYKCKMACNEIMENHTNPSVKLTFILDYDFAENRTDMKFNKKQYSIKGKIICEDFELETAHMMDTKIHILFDKVRTTLLNNGIENISIEYDMEKEDKEEMTGHLRFGGCTF